MATTGLSGASSMSAVNVCAPPGPVGASCLSQVLVNGHSLRNAVHPRLRRASSPYRLGRRRARPAADATPLAATAAAAPQAGTPAYLQQAYDLSYLSQEHGSDRTIAVVTAYDDATAESDLATYRAKFNLPECSTSNGCFKKLSPTGPPRFATGDNHTDVLNAWAFETSIDLQAISALCPNCKILLSEARSYFSVDLAAAQSRARVRRPT